MTVATYREDMTTLTAAPDAVAVPVLWLVATRAQITADCSDAALARFLPSGRSRKLKSVGHDADGVHLLITRGGTPLHTDTAYARYSHQLVLRNDGNRVRGTDETAEWHPPMTPGVMYALDTHSPHQGLPDPRLVSPHMAGAGPAIVKVVIAVDRDELLTPGEAWPLLKRMLNADLAAIAPQATKTAPRYRPKP